MVPPVMSLKNVGVCYRGILPFSKRHWALEDISFDVFQGETLGVIGKNGAGKSTLLKLLGRILHPDTGAVEGTAQRIQLLSLQVGFVPELSGRENAILSGLLLGLSKKQCLERMSGVIEFSGLESVIDDPINTYSSGMRARLGFAVSCQADPDLLLIDEVLGVGDRDFRQKSRDFMLSRMKSDKSFVLVSHNEATIMEHCQRAVWIEGGRVKMYGEAEQVVKAYQAK
jgi:lipopolysaccharide transport system ATP-binding protein